MTARFARSLTRILAAKQGLYRFEQISLPKYLKKDGYFPLIIPRVRVKEGFFEVPMSKVFKKEFGKIAIPFPERLQDKKLKEVRILPKCGAQWFEVEFITSEPKEPQICNPHNAVAIDLGLDNLAACVSTTGASIVIDGKKLKSINQCYNKINAQLQSVKDKQGIQRFTKRQGYLLRDRNNRVRDYISKTARRIINWCVDQQIGTLIVGVNPGWKQSINIGKRNNQTFVQIPFHSLRSRLFGLCERYGIEYVEQEESYTSKASAVDGDNLPVFNPDNPIQLQFSGRRIKRGLYRSQQRHLVNADCNGAWNIGRKSKHKGKTFVSRGVLAAPLRIFIS